MDLGAIHLNAQNLRSIFLIFFVVLVIVSRMTRGTATETPDGLKFSMKPLLSWARLLFIPIYLGIIFYPIITGQHNMPAWVPVILVLLLIFVLYQAPGTILLTPTAVVQRFWFRADKVIQYPEVMAIQSAQAGRYTRVLGDNRVTITHTSGHSDSPRFRTELERRTNKTVQG
jgi:hypothetical protein